MKIPRQSSRLLLGLALLSFPGLAVTVTDYMVTKAVSTSGCTAPAPATAFLTTDQSVWLWFNVIGANAGDVPSATWYSPNGAAYQSGNWDPVASAGTWCYWWSINVAGNPPASSPGNWSVRVSWNGSALFSLNFTILAASVPSISTGGVVNAASYASGAAVAPGSIASAFGSFLLNSAVGAQGVPLPTSLSGLSMQFGSGTKVPLFYAASGQVNFQVPWELAGQSQASLTATVSGQTSAAQNVGLATFAPGIFSTNAQGLGQGAILDPSYKLVDTSNPATPGSTVVLIYCTGLGAVSNQPASGAPSPSNPPAATTTTPTVMIGGASAQVLFSGLAPGFVGEYQVNAQVPSTSTTGNAVPVTISIGGATSNAVTIAVQPVPITTTPAISSVSPNSASAGQVLTVALNGTNFIQGQTLANFGAGISVAGAPEGQQGSVTVATPTTATATLTIDPAAATGARTVTVATGAQTASLSNAFTVLAAPAPMAPLTVTSTSPANGATGVALTPTIQITFNGPLDPSTVGPSTFSVANGTTSLPATMIYDSGKYQVSMAPKGALLPGTTYTVTIAALLRNAAENPLGTAYSFSFTTVPPISITGMITPVSGLDPRTLTVLSYGGKTSTPDSNGNFSASVDPGGNTMVAAVFPGKSFALLGVLSGSGASATPSDADFPALLPASAASTLLAPRVHRTRWQITASTAAATSSNPVLDFQTTAESLLFMSPYLYTGDPQKSIVTQQAIAQSASTQQLAATLQSTMTGANAPSDPMTVAAIQSAFQGAMQGSLNPLLSLQFVTPTNANSTAPTILDVGCIPSQASSTFPQTVEVTPYCKNFGSSSSELPCLDLDFISFCDAVQADQSGKGYTFTPQNCTSNPGDARAWGCAVGWLARFAPIYPANTDPATIVAGGSNASEPESPIGYTQPCSTSFPCYGSWISGNSGFAKADVLGAFSSWVTSKIIPDSSGSLDLPSAPLNYIARFYSGGLADPQETRNIAAYTNGATLLALATGVNMAETALNIADVAFGLAPDPPSELATCALSNLTQSAIETAAGQVAGTVSGGVKVVANLGNSILTSAATSTATNCVVSEAVQSLFKFGAEALLASTGGGAVVDAVVNGAASAANAAEALQRSYELTNEASALETAVIEILPGSSVPNNPVPEITSLSPATAAVGGPAPTVTIKGNFLAQNCTVFANDEERDYTFVNSGTLTFDLESSDLGQAMTFYVAVTNPPPGGGTSMLTFTVGSSTGSNPQPQVTSLTPSAAVMGAVVGASTIPLSILGNNFMSNSTVTFAGSPHPITTPFDAGQLTIKLTATDLAKTGTVPVVVTNPGPGGGSSTCTATTSSCNFTVLGPTPSQPAVTAASTSERIYVAGDQFELSYAVLANPMSQTKYDLMITILSLASGTTYYYYDNPSDTNEWLHTTVGAAVSNYIPESGNDFYIPSNPSAFQITSEVPSGDYHVKAYFSVVNANQQIGTSAETDFSVATTTAAGGCFVATAAFGSPMARQVQWLRAFRDRILLPGRAGRAFVNWYYGWSPRAATWLRGHAGARKLTRAMLWIPVAYAWLSLRTNVALALLGFLVLILLLGWSLRRGPAWWRALCLLGLVIGLASAHTSGLALGQSQPTAPAEVFARDMRSPAAFPGVRQSESRSFSFAPRSLHDLLEGRTLGTAEEFEHRGRPTALPCFRNLLRFGCLRASGFGFLGGGPLRVGPGFLLGGFRALLSFGRTLLSAGSLCPGALLRRDVRAPFRSRGQFRGKERSETGT
jgi:uncharacterized protein (TIGR03437 family)